MLDARFAVRDGLHALLAEDPAAYPGPTPLVFRGRLLDRVGSDARPLVMLLATVAERGVYETLRGAAARGDDWRGVRGPLVVSLTQEHYLQPEMAQWAVECWGYALGLVSVDALTPGIARPMPAPVVRAPAAAAVGNASPRPSTAAASGPPRTAYRPAPAPLGYRPPRPNIGPLGVRRPARGLSTRTVKITLYSVGAFVALSIAAFIVLPSPERPPAIPAPLPAAPTLAAAPVAPAQATPAQATPAPPVRAPARVAPAPPAPTVASSGPVTVPDVPSAQRIGIPVLPPALPGVTQGALPATRADSARLVVVRPPVRATLAQEQRAYATQGLAAERPGTGALNVGTGRMDRVVKRDGNVLIGRVEVIRASEIQFVDADTRLRYAIPKREIREVVTEFGSVVRFSADAARATRVEESVGPLVRRGVGGLYDVSYAVRSVNGSPVCKSLWQKPPAPSEIFVTHLPGADTLQLRVDRGGTFAAVIDPAASFSTSLLPQPEASVGSSAITSRMSGTFSATGFTGEVNIIGYRRQPTGQDITCHSVLDARGVKRSR
jgi:hypothetical protein